MSDTSLRTFLICIVSALFILTAAHLFISDFSSHNNITSNPEMDEIYSNFSKQLDNSLEWSYGFQNSSGTDVGKLTDTGGEASVIKSLYVSIKMPYEQGKVAQSTLASASEALGIKRFAYYSFISILIIVMVCIFIGLVTRTRAP